MRRTVLALVALVFVVAATPAAMARSTAAPPPAAPGALGTVTTTTQRAPSCPAGHLCQVVTVSCPGIRAARDATLAIGATSSRRRGLVALFTGGTGGKFWGLETAEAADTVTALRAAGFEVVQVRWHQSWLASAPGEQAGSALLACRPATIVRWIHDTRYMPLHLDPAQGVCGFCVSGTSGGASAVSYTLSHYGLDVILDGVFPVGGPPHAALVKGCRGLRGEEGYWYEGDSTKAIDSSYGYVTTGPCTSHDASFQSHWIADGIESTGSDFAHPQTRIHILVGSRDPVMGRHAADYAAVLQANGTALVLETVKGMGHDLSRYPQGLNRLYQVITQAAA
jgi:hypothetical protein